MNFDSLSFAIGKHGDSGPVRDVVSYLMGRAVAAAGEIWQTITNVAVATFTTVSATLRELVIDVTPLQSGTGDPSPTNVRPISGWTGSNVVTAKSTPYCQINKSGGFWQGTAGQVESDGATIRRTFNTNSSINAIIPSSQVDTFLSNTKNLPAGAYTCSADVDISVSGVSVSFVFSDANGNNSIWIANGTTRNIPDGFKLQIIEILKNGERVSFTEADHIYVSNIVVAIAPHIYRITFPVAVGTVYGGTLTDNGDGTWTLQPMYKFFDAASVTWDVRSANTTTWIYSNTDFVTSGVDYAEKYAQWTGSINDTPLNSFRVSATSGVYVNTGDNTDASNKPTGKFVLKYKTDALPAPITLSAESVKTLLGDNNIFADCGNINTITFRTQ